MPPKAVAAKGDAEDSAVTVTIIEDESEDEGSDYEQSSNEEGEDEGFSIGNYLFANTATYQLFSSDAGRSLSAATFGIDVSRPRWQVHLEASSWQQELTLQQELVDPGYSGPDPRTRKLEIQENDTELDELYVSVSPLAALTFKLGRRKIIWGQFPILSPVDVLLPLRSQTTNPYISKVNFRRPQDRLQLSLSISERVELQLYSMDGVRVDPLLDRFIEEQYPDIDHDQITDHDQTAARLMFYPDWGIFGFTWYKGSDSFFYSPFSYASSHTYVGNDSSNQVNRIDLEERPALSDLTGYGFELMYASGNWQWIVELSLREATYDLRDATGECFAPPNAPACQPNRATLDYLTWIVKQNKGRFYVPSDTLFGGFGFSYASSGPWNIDVGLLFFNESLSGNGDEGKRLSELVSGDDDGVAAQVAPLANIAYSMGANRNKRLSFSLGFLGTAAGATFAFIHRLDSLESLGVGQLSYSVSLDALQFSDNFQLSELNDDNGRYELKDDLLFAPRLSLNWKF